MKYTGQMDKECIVLCDALNEIDGIATTESCCGHGERPYHIWIRPDNLESLPFMLYWFDGCHCGFYRWKIYVYTDCAMRPATFMIEGPTGKEAYEQSLKIAEYINEDNPSNRQDII
jgi:hypothetical protein